MFKHFRRITSNGKYVAEIDGVRFVAIAMVLVQHLHERVLRNVSANYPAVEGSRLEHLLMGGGLGVSIFFALSGYVLYSILKRSTGGMGAYYLRRLTRLEPPYILISTLIFLALALHLYHGTGKFLGHSDAPLWQSYLATITYTHCLIFGMPPSVNPPGWSLEAEVQFYIVAPLMATAVVWCKDWRLRAGMLFTVIVFWIFTIMPLVEPHAHIKLSLLFWFPYFLMGFVIFEVVSHHPFGNHPLWKAVDFLAVGALLLLPLFNRNNGVSGDMGRCLLIGIFLLGALSGSWLRGLMQIPWVANIGGMCYTIYLTHVPLIELLVKVTTHLHLHVPYAVYLAVQAVIVLPLVLAIAAVMFVLIERPCMNKNWPRDLWQFLTGKLGQPAPASATLPISRQNPADG